MTQMGRPKLLPDAETLKKHRTEDKWSYRQIGEHYGVGISAVAKALKRADKVTTQVTYRDVVPWEIPRHYHNTATMDRIRSVAKQKQGVALKPEEQRKLDSWLNDMAESMVVLDFHPDAPPNAASPKLGGFHYRTRVPADQHFWRDPEINKQLAAAKRAAARPVSGQLARITQD